MSEITGQDWWERYKRRRADDIIKSGTYFSEHEIFCAYCAHSQCDIWDFDIQPNNEEVEVQCEKCKRHFAVKARVTFSGRRLK